MTISPLKKKASRFWKKMLSVIDSRPLVSFFGFLGLLLLLIIIGSFLRRPAAVQQTQAPEPKLVEDYSFGESPKMTFTAKVEKAGVISIYAQAPGIVQQINTSEGKRVGRGSSLVSLSTSYQGGNTAALARDLAQKNYDATVANFELQTDIIRKQRDLAEKGNIQAEQMREITRQSLNDTRASITLNETILSSLDAQLTLLQQTNVNGSNDSAILGVQQGKAAVLAGLSQLRSGLRLAEYSSDEEKTPAQIADLGKDLTLRQLDLQERGITLARDISELNLKMAKVSSSLMYPAAPCAGVVERLYVKVGQNVNPGTLIATIKADQGETTALVLVPGNLAKLLSKSEPSVFQIAGKKVSLTPRYVSQEATDGTLHSVLYSIPALDAANLTNTSTIEVSIPMGNKKIVTDALYIPLDSVYQTEAKAYVYVESKQADGSLRAQVKEVTVGDVSGNYVNVTSGLTSSDVIIISRTVQQGDIIRRE